jgi:hypothetical protein
MSGKTKIEATSKAGKKAKEKNTKAPPKVKAKPAKMKVWKHDDRNPFRKGAYQVCYDILSCHSPAGLPRAKLVELLAQSTGKSLKLSAYNVQVLLSAKGNQPGLNRNEGPRHRSCQFGFWVERTDTGLFKLMVDEEPK